MEEEEKKGAEGDAPADHQSSEGGEQEEQDGQYSSCSLDQEDVEESQPGIVNWSTIEEANDKGVTRNIL